ncbi:TPA: hypothetical protein N0F65_005800 [Lagenidium giganteum]|uniref:Gluconeogenesis factor n=1 Tax=Lagenidium giganteum TaxID=4803 RepID=A0AAV2YGK6_9STRA|nr:TPA: hypothetical protein N0F65_005800 [Lagenidium giganteum]
MILDDVLYDHTGLLGHLAIDRAMQQAVAEKAFKSGVAAYEALQVFRNTYGYRKRFPRFVDSLVTQNILSEEAAVRVVKAYYESQIPEAGLIKPFERARDTLQSLSQSGYQLGLVLVGKEDVQRERLRALGLQEFFPHMVFVPSNPSLVQLTSAMKEICRRMMMQPSSVVFVGRKVFYEIKAANKVGFVTVRMLHGKYASVSPIEELELPDFQIESIEQLVAVLRLADQQVIRPKIVAIGGGTGLAILLKELRKYPADLTAIVTVFDSGRHSGALRKYLGILPPGDIRNCLVALSDSDELMHKLMTYRFKENFMEGCSLGNLLLAALTDIQGGFDKAITSLSDILNIHGNVFPATLDDTELCAELEDGTVVVSEVNVRSPTIVDENGSTKKKAPIKRAFLQNENVEAFLPAIKAIENADIIVLSPGGFYTSIIATLLVPGIRDAIKRSAGATVYISNVATQTGQTDGYTLADSVQLLYKYLGDNSIDYIVANNAEPPAEAMEWYFARGEQLMLPTKEMIEARRPRLLQGKTFEDIEANGITKEWDKTPMIKHCGKMVVDMLYRIIDQEIEDMKRKLKLGGHFLFQPSIPDATLATAPDLTRTKHVVPSPRAGTRGPALSVTRTNSGKRSKKLYTTRQESISEESDVANTADTNTNT